MERQHEAELDFILQATEQLAESLDYRQTLQRVCAAAVATVADVAIVDLGDADSAEFVAGAHRSPELDAEVAAAGEHLESDPGRPQHPVCRVLKTGETYFAEAIDEQWIEAYATRPQHAAYLRRVRYTSLIVVPLHSRVFGLTGALTLATVADGHPPFTRGNLPFVQALGRLFAAAIGKAKLYQIAHATAASFQRAALPRILQRPGGVEFYAIYEPAAETLTVGGDWYDAFPLPDGRIGVCVGDVSGHGIHASVLMTSVRTALRAALISQPDISRGFDVADYLLRTESPGEFCTALLAIIDLDAMTLRLGSAGHPGPKIWDPASNSVTDPFQTRDVPLGLRNLASEHVEPKTIRLEPGSFLAFFTDGLIEWNRKPLEGDAALEAAIAKPQIRHAADPALAIREAVIGTAKAPDDTAILVGRLPVA